MAREEKESEGGGLGEEVARVPAEGPRSGSRAGRSQRWRARRSLFVEDDRPFEATRYGVEPIGDRMAKAFVEAHHYGASYPAAVAAFGLFEGRRNARAELVGTAVFSVPMRRGSAQGHGAPEGAVSCDLGRLCLLDEVPGTAETWFLRRAMKGLGRAKVDGAGRPRHALVLACSDPMPRRTAEGVVVMPGHLGHVYGPGGSATYLGRGKARTLVLDRQGRVLSERTLSKIKGDERGAAHAHRRLVEAGAPPIEPGEDPAGYVRRAVLEGPFTMVRHPGNHRYAFVVGTTSGRRATRKAILAKLGGRLAYPGREDEEPGTA